MQRKFLFSNIGILHLRQQFQYTFRLLLLYTDTINVKYISKLQKEFTS